VQIAGRESYIYSQAEKKFGIIRFMSEATRVLRVLEAAKRGNPQSATELLPLVYEELRKLAAQKVN
jgi:hypothetical protein